MTDENDALVVVTRKPSRREDLAMAALISPLSFPLAIFVIWVAMTLVDGGRWDFGGMGGVLVFATIPPLVTTVVIGLPIALWLHHMGWLNALVFCAVGCVVGAGVLVAILSAPGGHLSIHGELGWASLVGGGTGLLVAMAFCLLARVPLLGRLEKDA